MENELKARLNVMMDKTVLIQLDEYAKKNGISRSGAISVLVVQALSANKGLESINELNDLIKQVQKKNEQN